jgi:predicted nucleic acid-binding protein
LAIPPYHRPDIPPNPRRVRAGPGVPQVPLSDQEIRALVEEELLPFVDTVRVRRRLAVVERDPDDNKFLECAVTGRASYLVTGDRDLHEVGSFRGITILTAGQLPERLGV